MAQPQGSHRLTHSQPLRAGGCTMGQNGEPDMTLEYICEPIFVTALFLGAFRFMGWL